MTLPAHISCFLDVLQAAPQVGRTYPSMLLHLGALGLFLFAILDSSPLPTFGGLDVLTAVLAASHRGPWYYYAAVATAGSLAGAVLTFRMARRAGSVYLHRFGRHKAPTLLKSFQKWGTGALVAVTAVPLPFPTSAYFAAAGISDYPRRKYVSVVALSRGIRYTAIAVIADHYGRHFITVLRHPSRYWGWLLLMVAVVAAATAGTILVNRRLEEEARTEGRSHPTRN